MLTSSRPLCLAAAAVFALAPWCSAVIIRGGDGTGNITQPTIAGGAPADVTAWANVGSVGNGSAIYIGGGWALTAAHVNRSTPFNFAGMNYTSDQVYRLHESIGSSSLVDVVLIHLSTSPALPSLTLASGTPASGSNITLIGSGVNRATSPTEYQVAFNSSTNTYTWTPVTRGPVDYTGFIYASGNTKRWGANTISGGTSSLNVGYGNTTVFPAVFDAAGGMGDSEGMLADGDSGGGVFLGNTLVGILDAKGTYQDQPTNTAIFGNVMYMTNLATYVPEIQSLIPEPSGAALLGAAAMAFLSRRRRAGVQA